MNPYYLYTKKGYPHVDWDFLDEDVGVRIDVQISFEKVQHTNNFRSLIDVHLSSLAPKYNNPIWENIISDFSSLLAPFPVVRNWHNQSLSVVLIHPLEPISTIIRSHSTTIERELPCNSWYFHKQKIIDIISIHPSLSQSFSHTNSILLHSPSFARSETSTTHLFSLTHVVLLTFDKIRQRTTK